jgi:hypothetical protein
MIANITIFTISTRRHRDATPSELEPGTRLYEDGSAGGIMQWCFERGKRASWMEMRSLVQSNT